ncbi:MAG: hypothetical protein B7Z67_01105 [Acidiphilium sp. 21-60-14]|nr:MAG: hypothetical protein B7Z67_01105 [Acidiphilium sp. 21-60-14]OYV91878.1 MAG: hypothetical protein B7Z57_03505 [Acidiphilium sp. 37-60-79]OZB41223.1 MAG: hypothetical protein B7X48_00780 [Acidiphilium sp. 34-60-192]
MSMKVTESDREALMQELDNCDHKSWIEVQSEIQYCGDELPVWFLVSDKQKAIETWSIFLKTIKPYLDKFTETEFSTSFRQLAGDQIIWWDALDDDDIRKGTSADELCKYPDVDAVDPEFPTVFDTVKRYVAESKK